MVRSNAASKINTIQDVAPSERVRPSESLTLIIRTDRHFALNSLSSYFERVAKRACTPRSYLEACKTALATAYPVWGEHVLAATADYMDYEGHYGMRDAENQRIDVHFHNATTLAVETLKKSRKLIGMDGEPAVYVSLDDMIGHTAFNEFSPSCHHTSLRFSRLFDTMGQEITYIGSPGYASLQNQLQTLSETIETVRQSSGNRKPSIILVEDNVRRAKMMNWVIDQMQGAGIWKQANLAGIATCFAVAQKEEREKIKLFGKVVPMTVGVDYADAGPVDVVTTRDLFFDGPVVQTNDGISRLPSCFLPVDKMASNFKIQNHRAEDFAERITLANLEFCATIRKETGMDLPIEAFATRSAISMVTGLDGKTPVAKALASYRAPKNAGSNQQHTLG